MESLTKHAELLEAKQKDLEKQSHKHALLDKNIKNCEKSHDRVHKNLETLMSNSVLSTVYKVFGLHEAKRLKKEREAKTLRKHMDALKREYHAVSREIEVLESDIASLKGIDHKR